MSEFKIRYINCVRRNKINDIYNSWLFCNYFNLMKNTILLNKIYLRRLDLGFAIEKAFYERNLGRV